MESNSLKNRDFRGRQNILKSFDLNNFLDYSQRIISIVNQAMPIINQIKPMISNAVDFLSIYNNINKDNGNANGNSTNNTIKKADSVNNNSSNSEQNNKIFYT